MLWAIGAQCMIGKGKKEKHEYLWMLETSFKQYLVYGHTMCKLAVEGSQTWANGMDRDFL